MILKHKHSILFFSIIFLTSIIIDFNIFQIKTKPQDINKTFEHILPNFVPVFTIISLLLFFIFFIFITILKNNKKYNND